MSKVYDPQGGGQRNYTRAPDRDGLGFADNRYLKKIPWRLFWLNPLAYVIITDSYTETHARYMILRGIRGYFEFFFRLFVVLVYDATLNIGFRALI